jgi:hypothetical protein
MTNNLLHMQDVGLAFGALVGARWAGADERDGSLYFDFGYPLHSRIPVTVAEKLVAMADELDIYRG